MHKAKRKMTPQPGQCNQCVNFDWQCIFNLVAKKTEQIGTPLEIEALDVLNRQGIR